MFDRLLHSRLRHILSFYAYLVMCQQKYQISFVEKLAHAQTVCTRLQAEAKCYYYHYYKKDNCILSRKNVTHLVEIC